MVSWLFTLALIIEAAMIWDGTKYLMGALIFIFALVRVYGYGLVNKYYGELQDFVSVRTCHKSFGLVQPMPVYVWRFGEFTF